MTMDESSLPQKGPQWGPTFAAIMPLFVFCSMNVVFTIVFLFMFYLMGMVQISIVYRDCSAIIYSWDFNRKRTAVLNGL